MSEYVVNRENVWPYGSQREEIVRCRDCKYMHIWDVSAIYQNHDHDSCHCLRFVDGCRMTVMDNGFCAWGERK